MYKKKKENETIGGNTIVLGNYIINGETFIKIGFNLKTKNNFPLRSFEAEMKHESSSFSILCRNIA